jgi:hypothetical protein
MQSKIQMHSPITMTNVLGHVKFSLPQSWIEFFHAVKRKHFLSEKDQFKPSLGHSYPPPASMRLFALPIVDFSGTAINATQAVLSFLLGGLLWNRIHKTKGKKRIICIMGAIWALLSSLYFIQSNAFLSENEVIMNPFNIITVVAGLWAIIDNDEQNPKLIPIPVVVKKNKRKNYLH